MGGSDSCAVARRGWSASWAEVAEGGGDVGWRVVGGGLDFEQHVRLFIDGIALSCKRGFSIPRFPVNNHVWHSFGRNRDGIAIALEVER